MPVFKFSVRGRETYLMDSKFTAYVAENGVK